MRNTDTTIQILLAEDNPGDVLLVRDALESEHLDFELTVKRDGHEMLKFLEFIESGQALCPGIVLLDLNLPKYSGAFLLERFRESSVCAHVPVVIVTSSDSQKDRQTATRLRASGYFRKPSDYDEFMRLGGIVRALLAKG
jgi:CheY-like chemotaxis protein